MKKLWDISPPISAQSPVFPGDTPYAQQWAATLSDTCPVNVSAITMSPHVGAHADAPLHYDPQGAAVGALDLAPFLGRCRVIHALDARPLITLAHLQHALTNLPPRVLVRTYRQFPLAQFDTQLTGFDPDCLQHLADLGVLLIGTDSADILRETALLLESREAYDAMARAHNPFGDGQASARILELLGQDVVGHPERVDQRRRSIDDREQPFVGNRDDGVDGVTQRLELARDFIR